MSAKDAVRDTKTEPSHESEPGADGVVVDIGIAVDVSLDDDPSPASSADVEFEIEVADLLEASDTDCVFDAIPDEGADASIEPDERDALGAAEIDPEAVVEREYSYRSLLDDGVDESTAGVLRWRYSLLWSSNRTATTTGARAWYAASGPPSASGSPSAKTRTGSRSLSAARRSHRLFRSRVAPVRCDSYRSHRVELLQLYVISIIRTIKDL